MISVAGGEEATQLYGVTKPTEMEFLWRRVGFAAFVPLHIDSAR